MRNIRILFAVSVLAVFSAVSISAQTTAEPVKPTPLETTVASATVKNERYRIGFQDILDVQVFNHANLNQRVPVGPNGTILLFRIDRPIVAVCKTERELAAEIADAYKEKYLRNPLVTVNVAQQQSQSVSVLGAVVKPERFFINRRVHLLEVLALAGGPNKEAGTRLIVARSGSSSNCKDPAEIESDEVAVFGFKVRDILEGKQTFWMKPGDTVSVLDSDIIYMYGNVNRQGSFKVREPVTLTQAIVNAEGLKPAARKEKIRVLRQKEGSTDREELIFDLNQIDKGKVKDPYLEPNDIVAISEDKTKSILQGFVNAIKGTVPNMIYRLPTP